MTLPDMWKEVKSYWAYGLTPKTRLITLIIIAIILFAI